MDLPVVPAESRPSRTRDRRLKSRGWIFASGAFAGLTIVLMALIALGPLLTTRSDLHEISTNGVPLQAQLVGLRTTVVEWQFFIERHLDTLTPGVAPDPTDLVKGGQLVTRQTAQAKALSKHLTAVGLTADAHALDSAMSTFNAALAKLIPVASGTPIAAALLTTLVSNERTAIEGVWALTTQIGDHVLRAVTMRESNRATQHLGLGLWLLLVAVAIALLLVVLASVIFGRRAGQRERDRTRTSVRLAYEGRVQEALEMTKTEGDVYAIVGEALSESLPDLNVEMLIADSSRAHFRRALTNGDDFEGCSVVSPLDCPAATVGHSLLFPSSRAINACPYLKHRPSGECSAACLPVSIAGRTVGVTHAVGPDGTLPSPHAVDALNFTSRHASERIAMIRAFATSETQARTDPLTGLLNRRSLENAVRDLRTEGIPYALAYGDLDHFKILNDTHGHEAGDQALRLFARVLGESLRPNDIAGRYGGEEFVIVLPNCDTDVATGVLERVRETLALALSGGHLPPFTVTFGLASTAYASDFDTIVAIADRALLGAKSAGRNRVTVADIAGADTSGADTQPVA